MGWGWVGEGEREREREKERKGDREREGKGTNYTRDNRNQFHNIKGQCDEEPVWAAVT